MKNQNLGLLILRTGLGILMLLHGITKVIKGVGGIQNMLSEKGFPEFFAYFVYFGEILAPLMLIFGFRTRVASLLYIIIMLGAVYLANFDKITTLLPSGGWGIELQALFITGALALFFTGGGKYALSTKNKWD